MNINKSLILSLIIVGYAFVYIATSKDPCSGDCKKIEIIRESLKLNRPYLLGVYRCINNYRTIDSLCVKVTDTTGVNWGLLADTACMVASQNGLPDQKIFILRFSKTSSNYDTLAFKECH